MQLSNDQKARIKRVVVNAAIVMVGAGTTAGLQFLGSLDFGQYAPFVAGFIAIAIKAVQAWAHPGQEEYMPK